MSYLCLKHNNSKFGGGIDPKPKPQSKVSASGKPERTATISTATSVCEAVQPGDVEAYSTSGGDAIVLPTFSAELLGPDSTMKVRVFKDGGCQRSFISQRVVDRLCLPINNENRVLTIDGFNSAKTINAQTASLDLKIGNSLHKFEPLIIDQIRTRFSVTNIHKVMNTFKRKGYRMADPDLASLAVVSDIEVILGTCDDDLLPMQHVTFGSGDRKSSYISTELGAIMAGSID